jgi:adenylate cyclase
MKRAGQITIFLFVILEQHVAFAQNKQLIDSLQKALKTASSDSVKASVLNKLSNSYFSYDNDKSIQYAQEAYKVSASTGYKSGMGVAYENIGWVHLNRDNYPEALKNLRQAIKIKNETGNKRETIRCHIALGHAYLGQGNYPEALNNYFQAISINEATGTTFGKDHLYQNIALVYDEVGNYTEALKYYHESILVSEATGRKLQLTTTYINIASTYLKLKNYEKAQTYNLSALQLSEESGDIQGKAFALSQIGIVYKAQRQYTTALDYLIRSLKIADDNGFKQLQITVLNEIGTAYLFQNKYPYARNYLNKSLAISKEIGSINNISNCYVHLSQLDSAQGNSTMSLRNYKLHILYRDSALNLESVRKSEQLRMQFEMDKKEATTKAEQEKKDVLTQKELQKQKLVRNAFIGGFIFVLIFAGVFLRQRNKIAKARKLSDELLLNILPAEVAEELKAKGHADAKQFDGVTVMFTDFKDFTQISERLTPSELVAEIHTCFKAFDNIISKHNIEKIKTIGDAYMCAGGLPVANTTHAVDVLYAALEIQQFMLDHLQRRKNEGKELLEIRIGIHTGPVVAGIVGVKKFAYDIWGDTVNIASRMESSGEEGKVNISGSTYELVKDKFACMHRGKIQAKNKGQIDMYFVERRI